MSTRVPPWTLRNFSLQLPLHCHHCETELPESSPVKLFTKCAVVECPKCGLQTPFKLEQRARV